MPSTLTNPATEPVTEPATPAGSRRRPLAVAAVAALALLAAPAAPAGAGSAASPPATTQAAPTRALAAPTRALAADYAAGYLGRQIRANGGYVESFGVPDVPSTAYAVLGLAATGVGKGAAAQAVAYLQTQLGAALKGSDGTDDPARLAYDILAATATGTHPRRFGGTSARHDLVARLLATARTTGPDAGLFGSADPTYDGAFRQGVALAALKGAGVPADRLSASLGWLVRQQCANGTWTGYRADTSVPCPAADPATFAGPDTNSTGMAAQGLAAYGRHPHRSRLLATLDAIQSGDGGFPYLAAPGQSSDPSSTALSIQAILASGAWPASDRFTRAGRTPYQALASFQLGCSAPAGDRGALFYPGSPTPNSYATVQAVPALMGRTLPLARSTLRYGLPTLPCPAPASATTSAAAPTASPTMSATMSAPSSATMSWTSGACVGRTGVTVVVDFTAFGGRVKIRCALGDPGSGIAALRQAGFTPSGTQRYGMAFVCRIDGLPGPRRDACVTTPPANAYWAYWHAGRYATSWSYSTQGPLAFDPVPGSIQGWAFGASAKPSKTPAQVRST